MKGKFPIIIFWITLLCIIVAFPVLFLQKKVVSIDSSGVQNTDENKKELASEKLKEKIGQMILVGFRGASAPADSYITNVIKDLNVGGVILFDYDVPSQSFPRNIISPSQTKKLISDLQLHAKIPLFISVDAEGGKVNRLKEKYGFLPVASAKEMAEKGVVFTASESNKLARQLKDLGFNMNFAPVVDVDANPDNPIIGLLGRSFSFNEQEVTKYAAIFVQEHKKHNVISVEKHFPGHGSSTADSHKGVVDITKTYQEKELYPYKDLQEKGLLNAVMTAHIMNKNIDPAYPATLSQHFLQSILRKEIGFNGVIISDDMNMNAIVGNYGFEDAVIRAVNAGCDILLFSNNGTEAYDEQLPYKAVDVIYKAVEEGSISKEKIEESYIRIKQLKQEFEVI
jgi:beta-N-acetylhexosaminidase